MTQKEIEDLVNGLPNLPIFEGVGSMVYVINDGGTVLKYEYLLLTGELVKSSGSYINKGTGTDYVKRCLKEYMRNNYGTFIGVAYFHKELIHE